MDLDLDPPNSQSWEPPKFSNRIRKIRKYGFEIFESDSKNSKIWIRNFRIGFEKFENLLVGVFQWDPLTITFWQAQTYVPMAEIEFLVLQWTHVNVNAGNAAKTFLPCRVHRAPEVSAPVCVPATVHKSASCLPNLET